MPPRLRYTFKRGRPVLPLTLLRTRKCRFCLAEFRVFSAMFSCSLNDRSLASLPRLVAHILAHIADSLALERFRRAHFAHAGGGLADQLFFVPTHGGFAFFID